MQKRKKFKIHLTTMAPVHIGSGQIYSSKEYIYENGKYYFPESEKLFKAIKKLGLESVRKYEIFLQQPSRHNNPLRLVQFLNDIGLKEREFGGYKIKENGFETEKTYKKGKINRVSSFIKDPYGNPYVPGSSLKGAIRTIIENDPYLDKIINNITINNDLFKNILVSDSASIKVEQLTLVQKWDFSKKKDAPCPIPVYRESLKPFTRIEFTIDAIGKEAIKVISNLQLMAQSHYNKYKCYFLSEFEEIYIQDNIHMPLYLGAGSGFWTKVNINKANPLRHQKSKGRTRMEGKGVLKLTKAPKKQILVKGNKRLLSENPENFYEMGKCNFYIKELEE